MLIEIPNEILNSDLGLGKKLIVGIVLTYPHVKQTEVAKLLGVTPRAVQKSVQEAKIAYEHMFAKSEQLFAKHEQLFARSSSSLIENEKPVSSGLNIVSYPQVVPPPVEVRPPTKEEVVDYANSEGRADIAEEFWKRCEEDGWKTGRGEPIANWKKWFRGWASKTPKPAAPKPPRMTPEQARMAADQSY